ncbi:hypothetical protein GUJ93_ZPchr0012g20198 [Zizania palustris]|uniref:Uncharacterized protein n=1 Tax=Zizania palustris TaxID=103762 RepID=A0A8J5WNR9_ZIZPA|nr:hypothetical protein GUJ93_ZPchr0012g20198 [Zizania palustris]
MLPSSQMAMQLTLLLISCSLYSMYSSSSSSSFFSCTSSSSLALLVLVISTCLSLLFSNLRQLIRASSHKAKPLPSMEEAAHQEENIVPQDEVANDAPEDLAGSLSESSDSPVSEDCAEEGLVSDDDDDDGSLIEISLVDGHYVGQQKQRAWKEQDLLAEFLPDLLLDKRDFIMDILSEISEEDNLIEIDIARGSIKCSNFGIKA